MYSVQEGAADVSTQPARDSTQEWERKLLITISGLLVFETLTGSADAVLSHFGVDVH